MDVFCDSRKFPIFSHRSIWFTIQLNQEFTKKFPSGNFDISWMDEVLPGFDNFMPSASGIKGAQTFPNATKNPRKKGLI